jgi:hypothetical protein
VQSSNHLDQGSAFLAHFGSFGSFFYDMALFIVGGDFLWYEIKEIKGLISNFIKLSMKFGFL